MSGVFIPSRDLSEEESLKNSFKKLLNETTEITGLSTLQCATGNFIDVAASQTVKAEKLIYVGSGGGGALPDNQGFFAIWNKDGGGGRSHLINQRGGGPGGFVFELYDGGNNYYGPSIRIDSDNNLIVPTTIQIKNGDVSFDDSLYATSNELFIKTLYANKSIRIGGTGYQSPSTDSTYGGGCYISHNRTTSERTAIMNVPYEAGDNAYGGFEFINFDTGGTTINGTPVTIDFNNDILTDGSIYINNQYKTTFAGLTYALSIGTTTGGLSADGRQWISGNTNKTRTWRVGGSNASALFTFEVGTNSTGVFTTAATINSSGTYTAVSDLRLKKNVTNYTAGLDEITQLTPKTFNYKWQEDTERKNIGLIAQEVKDVLPSVVYENQNDDGQTNYSIDYSGLVMPLINAVKRLTARVATLEAKLNNL